MFRNFKVDTFLNTSTYNYKSCNFRVYNNLYL